MDFQYFLQIDVATWAIQNTSQIVDPKQWIICLFCEGKEEKPDTYWGQCVSYTRLTQVCSMLELGLCEVYEG